MPDGAQRTEYANPPIQEGMCQFIFGEPMPWNITTPGRLFDALSEYYPSDPEEQEQVEASLAGGEGAPLAANLAVSRRASRYLYRDVTGKRLAVANPTTFSVNSHQPYEGWPKLRHRLERDIKRLGQIAAVPPIAAVNLRYINRVSVRGPDMNTDDYFTIPLRTAREGQAYLHGFLYRVDSILQDEETQSSLTFASVAAPPGQHDFILDLELRRQVSDGSITQALDVADDLKVLENAEFENLITEKCRELFA